MRWHHPYARSLFEINARAVAAVLAILAAAAQAETFAVNSREGAQAALAGATAGDEVVMADGIYTNCVLLIGDPREAKVPDPVAPGVPEEPAGPLPPPALGTEEKPIVFRAQTHGQVIFTGATSFRIKGRFLVVQGFTFDQAWRSGTTVVNFSGAEHCRLSNCAFIDSGDPKSTKGRIVNLMKKSTYNRVDHCYMQGNLSMGMGITVKPDDCESSHNQFDHNHFKDIIARSSNGQEAVQLGQGGPSATTTDAYSLVEFNLFDNASGDAEIISSKSNHNTARYNTFRNCDAELTMRGGNYFRAEGNFFFNNKGGIRIFGNDHIVVNNYIENSTIAIRMPAGGAAYDPAQRCIIAYNTIVNSKKTALEVGEKIESNSILFNLFVSKQGILIKAEGAGANKWSGNFVAETDKAQRGTSIDGLQNMDPKLEEKDGLQRLSAGSPAIDVGSRLEGLSDDIDGQPRDAKPDAGCDERVTGDIRRRPLTPAEVGPDWMRGDPAKIKRIPTPKPIPNAKP
jgi:poly(beta-D-mannuronate) lyase